MGAVVSGGVLWPSITGRLISHFAPNRVLNEGHTHVIRLTVLSLSADD